ncbi:MAG: sugar phosphate isomerase/epimerase [Leptolyngbya sp. PLA3]|nr:MAG: sugar phosphate isomerase/epimerase [Cyanobacteria bacterium CYA]MCE7968007.1 sugar phosphate isomerase/epimerase [Leptolyngbya sp. PL-A3]
MVSRRQALAGLLAVAAAGPALARPGRMRDPAFEISLAQWSLHRAIRGKKIDHLDFAKVARTEFDIGCIEYVNQFFADKHSDKQYLLDMKNRAVDFNVVQRLIMIDGEGALGDAEEAKRTQAIDNHKRWVEAAKYLGCTMIRVNSQSSGSFDEQQDRAADGLRRLAEFAAEHEMAVVVENHGGLSSNGQWLAGVMKKVGLPNLGTLPDFGNFNLGDGKQYDRYQGVEELMPFAKAVSAKSHDFDEQGNEIHTDYRRMMKIVVDAGYHGYVGIEYEGDKLDEYAGIRATKNLLETIRDEMKG